MEDYHTGNEGHRLTTTVEVPAVYGKTFEELWQRLIEAAPDAMIFVEKSGRIAMVNEQMEELFGYRRADLIGKDVHLLIPERFHARHRQHVSRFFSEARKRPMGTGLKIYGRKRTGEEFRADISLSPLDIDGEVLVTAAVRDITERVRAEDQIEFDYQVQRVISNILKTALEPISLEEQLNRTLELIVSIPDPALDPKGLIYLFNPDTGEYVLKAHKGFQKESSDLPETYEFPCETCEVQSKPNCEISYTGNPDVPYELLYKKRDSFLHYCIPIYEGAKILGLISIFVRDWTRSKPREEVFFRAVAHTVAIIIKRYQIETERHGLIEKLSESEKLAALGRISANVAHEIRNPLTVVGGFARRLQKQSPEETRNREYADFIVREVGRLEEILKDILSYARTSILQLKEHSIPDVIDGVLEMYEAVFNRRSVMVRKLYRVTDLVSMDAVRFREVLLNIISNAIDAMPNGGELTISTGKEKLEGEPFVAIGIEDTGEGIPSDRLDKIFEPFYTTKIADRGIGLGLPISRKIMEDHGGFITVKSHPGKGSVFTLYLPLRRRD